VLRVSLEWKRKTHTFRIHTDLLWAFWLIALICIPNSVRLDMIGFALGSLKWERDVLICSALDHLCCWERKVSASLPALRRTHYSLRQVLILVGFAFSYQHLLHCIIVRQYMRIIFRDSYSDSGISFLILQLSTSRVAICRWSFIFFW